MIRRFLQNFLMGRNGFDSLARLTWALSLILMLLSFFGGLVGMAFELLAMVFLGYTCFRILSRNIYKRAAENSRYMRRTAGIRERLRGARMRFAQRKEYKFFKCPTCHAMLRVPRGKGKLQITCRRCGNRFSGKT